MAGAGRSGLSIRGFAMRLMHFGYRAYVVGEVCTPAIGAGDLLVIASGSGETQGMLAMARKAHQFGARVALLTMRPDSAIAAISDLVVTLNTDPPVINGAVQPEDWDVDNALTIRPSGAPFEIGLMIALDGVVYSLMVNNRMGIAQLLRMHANLE